ncbi:MGMT family protein [Patescibacteria group bacterium]
MGGGILFTKFKMQDPKAKTKAESRNFFNQVYEVIKKIPKGKVATYGQIATLLTEKQKNLKTKKRVTPKIVGFALHANKNLDVPCHRVVNKDGRLAENFAFDGWREQRNRLLAEGVEFINEKHVDLDEYLWKRPCVATGSY